MSNHSLRVRRLGIDTRQEAVVYMRRDCAVCRSEGFETAARVEVRRGERAIVATLNVVTGDLLAAEEAGLSEVACERLGAADGELVSFAHPPPLESLSLVRSKVYGRSLDRAAMDAIVQDGSRTRDASRRSRCSSTAPWRSTFPRSTGGTPRSTTSRCRC